MKLVFCKGIKFSVFADDLYSLLIPGRCGACGRTLVRSELSICSYCYRSLPRTKSHVWPCPLVEQKVYGRVPMQPVLAYLVFTRYGLTQDLIHHIKYENRYDLAYQLGRMYGQELKRDNYQLPAEGLIPVPLHWMKMYKRGYNQANEFASGLGEALDLPVLTEALVRRRNARSQTTKSRYDRWSVMDGQFTVNKSCDLKQRRVVLVDDVITTGSTLGSCAIALLKAGVTQVGVISLAVVQ